MAVTDEIHPLLTIELRICAPTLTRRLPAIGPMNTAAGLEQLYAADPIDLTERRWEGTIR